MKRLPERREDELAERAHRPSRGPSPTTAGPRGTSRANAAMTIVNEPPVRPRPTSTPPLSASAVAARADAHQRDAERVDRAARREHARRRRSDRRPRRRPAARAPTAGSGSRSRARTSRGPSRAGPTAASVNRPKLVRAPNVISRDQAAGGDHHAALAPPRDATSRGKRTRFGTVIEPCYATGSHSPTTTGQTCSLARTLEVVGERWTLLIVRDLFMGMQRFSDLARAPRHPARRS